MRLLITGSGGFIGSHLIRELEAHGHSCFTADVKDDPLVKDVSRRENVERLVHETRPDRVIHLAAKVGRLFGEDDVQVTVQDNAAMTALVAQVCGERMVPLSYASTSEVYGDQGDAVCSENSLRLDVLPHNAYGLSKRWGEEACRMYAPDSLQIWRISMPYGPGLPAGRGRAALINFLYLALHRRPLVVHAGSERSWCWVGDTVRAMRLLVEGDAGGAYNIGRDDNALPMLAVAEMACVLVGAPASLIELVEAPSRQTVVKRLATAKLRAYGWRPEVELSEGMQMTLDWVKGL